MRFAGVAMVAVFPILAGIYAAFLASKRVAALEDTLLFITLLKNDISYGMTPLPTLVCELSRHDRLCRLDYLTECAERCSRGEDFPSAWGQALNESRTLLKQDENARVKQLVLMLMTSDTNGQDRLCSICESHLLRSHELALAFRQKYSGLFVALGALTGVLACVLLL